MTRAALTIRPTHKSPGNAAAAFLLAKGGRNMTEEMLTPREVCAITKLSIRFLEERRAAGLPPRFLKLGTRVRYPAAALREWFSSSEEAGQ